MGRVGQVIFVGSLFAAGLSVDSPAPGSSPPRATTGPESSTGGVWDKRCALCHGKKGVPTPVGRKIGAQDLTSPEVRKKPDSALAEVIAEGKEKMPGYKDQLDGEEIAALVAHIRGFVKPSD